MMQCVTYGMGGFDPSKPNDNIVSVEEAPDPPEVMSTEDRLAVVEAQNAALLADLAKATSVAAVRAAATQASNVGDSPRE